MHIITQENPQNPKISQLQPKSARFFMKYLAPDNTNYYKKFVTCILSDVLKMNDRKVYI